MSSSVDPDYTVNYEPSHLDLHYLHKPIIIAYGSAGQKVLAKLLSFDIFWKDDVYSAFYSK